MTYLTSAEVKQIVHLAGHQIRLFLGNADAGRFQGDSKASITLFHQNPGEFSDEALLGKGANVEDAHQYPVRIELRGRTVATIIGHTHRGDWCAAQVVAKGIWGKTRESAIVVLRKELDKHCHPIAVRTAGSSSFEFNRAGVDKSLPIRYLSVSWSNVLKQMRYTPGQVIDSAKNRIIIAADGDGTVYDGPKTTHLPLLKDSPVYPALLAYLRAGGVFMLTSGNDLNRTFKRLIKGMPKDVYSRILLAANGGADLSCVDADGKPEFIKGYRQKALEIANGKSNTLDIVYIGDDASADGNDRAAFEAVGPQRAVVVKTLSDTKSFLEKWLREHGIPTV